MKFQRRLSEPHIVFLQDSPLTPTGTWLRRFTQASWSGFWHSVLKLMVGSAEPMIEKQCDPSGHVVYNIYDPITQQQVNGLSEAEARTWLEQRYYQ